MEHNILRLNIAVYLRLPQITRSAWKPHITSLWA